MTRTAAQMAAQKKAALASAEKRRIAGMAHARKQLRKNNTQLRAEFEAKKAIAAANRKNRKQIKGKD